ncbi:predicted protein [Chaetoceros tenuissimus]|uniref:Uncharacterized protein n=1 Tax=Chaetoceros tenuissimus TaxID=426638 RepID=A0AAD3CP29_9STRA|nr:predicted protein [Chaetoceros tenuissimus]
MLTMDSVFPNHWNKMRVGEALRVFSEKTLVEQFMTIGQELNCFNELLFSGNRNGNKFDAACQQVVSKCLHLLRDSILFSKQSKFSSLWYGLYYSIDKEKFLENGGPFSQLPQDLRENQCGLYMIIENLFKLLEKWLVDETRTQAEKKRENQDNKEESIDSRNSKITNFVGFAVYSLIRHYGSLERKSQVNEEKESEKEYNEIGTYLRRMQILHEDALLDVDYLKHRYSPRDQMLNHGGRTLISPEFFKFATILTSLCDTELSMSKISERGTAYLSEGIKNIKESEELRKSFEQFNDDVPLPVKLQLDSIYKSLVEKTARSRSSYELGRYREKNIGQYAKDSVTSAHRAVLKINYGERSAKASSAKADKELEDRKNKAK